MSFIPLALIIAIAPALTSAATPSSGYNKLQDIPVFKDALKGTWSGGDLVAPGSMVPIEPRSIASTEEPYRVIAGSEDDSVAGLAIWPVRMSTRPKRAARSTAQ